MLEIMLEDEDFAVSGFVSPISLTRSNRREMTFFVNGRWVQDQALSSALLQAYHTFLMVGRYPLAVLFIQMDPEDVDVNVHPAKAEVRFREPSRVFAGVQRAVRRGLLAHSPVPQLNEVRWQAELPSYPAQNYQNDRGAGLDWDMAASFSAGTATDAPDDTGIPGQPAADTGQQAVFSGSLPLLRLVGQVGGTYLVAEGPDGLYLIDQHAAHERVLFERMMGGKTANRPIAAQALLEPVTVQLPPESSHILTEQISVLNRFGFEVEAFGPNMFQVRAVPAILTHIDPANALKVIVEDFEEDETPLKDEIDARLIARICKRSAVKGGRILSQEEQAALLRDLEACQSPRTCPHGRPTMIHLSVNLLERQFGRLGSR
jgi:DNA mismatch repair protein MutL